VNQFSTPRKIYTKRIEHIKSYNTPEKRKILDLIQTGAELSQVGDYVNAISCYDEGLKIDPNDSNVLVNKGDALTNISNYDEAKQCYDKVLAKNPNSSMALYNKACLIALQGETEESLNLLEKAINIDSKLIDAAKTEGAFENLRLSQIQNDIRVLMLMQLKSNFTKITRGKPCLDKNLFGV